MWSYQQAKGLLSQRSLNFGYLGDNQLDKAHTTILPRVLCLAAIDSRDSFFGWEEVTRNCGPRPENVSIVLIANRFDWETIDAVGVNFTSPPQ
jgi:hypothetical protein